MTTQAQFIANAYHALPASLIKAVIRQSGGWSAFKEKAHDVTNHGAAGGFGGWIYYTETCAFYAKHQADIRTLATGMASEFGEGVAAMVENFNCLRGSVTADEVGETLYGTKRQHDTTVANALAWFALEEVARAYTDAQDD